MGYAEIIQVNGDAALHPVEGKQCDSNNPQKESVPDPFGNRLILKTILKILHARPLRSPLFSCF
jgi:hypothetical protein